MSGEEGASSRVTAGAGAGSRELSAMSATSDADGGGGGDGSAAVALTIDTAAVEAEMAGMATPARRGIQSTGDLDGSLYGSGSVITEDAALEKLKALADGKGLPRPRSDPSMQSIRRLSGELSQIPVGAAGMSQYWKGLQGEQDIRLPPAHSEPEFRRARARSASSADAAGCLSRLQVWLAGWEWVPATQWWRLRFDSEDTEQPFRAKWRAAFGARSRVFIVGAAVTVAALAINRIASATDTDNGVSVGVFGLAVAAVAVGSAAFEGMSEQGVSERWWAVQRSAALGAILVYELLSTSNMRLEPNGEAGLAYLHPTVFIVLASGLWLGIPRSHVGALALVRVVWIVLLLAAGEVPGDTAAAGIGLALGVLLLAVHMTDTLERSRRVDFIQHYMLEKEMQGLRQAIGRRSSSDDIGDDDGGNRRGSRTDAAGAGLGRALRVLRVVRQYVPPDVGRGIDRCATTLLRLNASTMQDLDSYLHVLESSGPLHEGEGFDWLASAGFNMRDHRDALQSRRTRGRVGTEDSFFGEGAPSPRHRAPSRRSGDGAAAGATPEKRHQRRGSITDVSRLRLQQRLSVMSRTSSLQSMKSSRHGPGTTPSGASALNSPGFTDRGSPATPGSLPASAGKSSLPPEMQLRRSASAGTPSEGSDRPPVGADPFTLFSYLPGCKLSQGPLPTPAPIFFDAIANDEVAAIVEQLFTDATFNLFAFDTITLEARTNTPLLVLGTAVLDRPHSGLEDEPEEATGVWSRLNIDRDRGINFLRAIDEGYIARNPYHNSTHAANVVWHANFLMQRCGLKHWLTLNEWFAAIIAAAIHDFAHPGLTNAYLVKAGAAIAVQHNDQSVLERYHLAEAFKVARRPGCRLFETMDPADYRAIRKMIVDSVLATDVSQHFNFIAELQQHKVYRLGEGGAGGAGFGDGSPQSDGPRGRVRQSKEATAPARDMLRGVVAVADIGHAALPWELHVKWSQRVQEEFFRQGDLERAKKIEVSPLSDRNAPLLVPKNQVGFYQYVAMPLFRAVGDALPLDHFDDVIIAPAKDNMARWESLAEQVAAGTIADPVAARKTLSGVYEGSEDGLDDDAVDLIMLDDDA